MNQFPLTYEHTHAATSKKHQYTQENASSWFLLSSTRPNCTSDLYNETLSFRSHEETPDIKHIQILIRIKIMREPLRAVRSLVPTLLSRCATRMPLPVRWWGFASYFVLLLSLERGPFSSLLLCHRERLGAGRVGSLGFSPLIRFSFWPLSLIKGWPEASAAVENHRPASSQSNRRAMCLTPSGPADKPQDSSECAAKRLKVPPEVMLALRSGASSRSRPGTFHWCWARKYVVSRVPRGSTGWWYRDVFGLQMMGVGDLRAAFERSTSPHPLHEVVGRDLNRLSRAHADCQARSYVHPPTLLLTITPTTTLSARAQELPLGVHAMLEIKRHIMRSAVKAAAAPRLSEELTEYIYTHIYVCIVYI